jgi:hypothetical protein
MKSTKEEATQSVRTGAGAWGPAYTEFVGYHSILEPCPATSGSMWQGRGAAQALQQQNRHIALAATQLV